MFIFKVKTNYARFMWNELISITINNYNNYMIYLCLRLLCIKIIDIVY